MQLEKRNFTEYILQRSVLTSSVTSALQQLIVKYVRACVSELNFFFFFKFKIAHTLIFPKIPFPL